ncbi:MAG: hypothetical protein NTY31_01200 [Candidatus Falkowbacteria bacterium]|nr:hypothetical protein [Candidatus Falkowbacteria bacterium]
MKKFFIVSTSFLALLLILTGCSKSSQTANKQTGQDNNNQPGRMRQPDFGQPDRQPDVRGVVKTIVGNEVTVLKIDMPAGGRNASSTLEQNQGDSNGSTSKNAISLVGGTGGPGGGAGRGMMGAGDPGGPGEQTSDTRAQMLAKLKEMSTGEEKIIIPVGIQMLKTDTSNNKREMVEATLADITADKNITIWISAVNAGVTASTTDGAVTRKIAEFVLIN